MTKKLIFGVLLLFALATACKKNTTAATSTTATGLWSLSSFIVTDTLGGITPILASQYQCIVNNQLLVNADGSAQQEFTGQDTCYLESGGNYAETFGIPGASTPGTWKLHNGVYTFIFTFSPTDIDTSNARVSVQGSTENLTFTDTLPISKAIAVTTYAK